MEEDEQNFSKKLPISSSPHLASIFGQYDANLRLIEKNFKVVVTTDGNEFLIVGSRQNVESAGRILKEIEKLAEQGMSVAYKDVVHLIQTFNSTSEEVLQNVFSEAILFNSGKRKIIPKSPNQKAYIDAIKNFDLVVGIGPAGTGKTYLAVALAITYLLNKSVSRIILARPAVEAGESLGFLPGDMYQKVNPYLRPLYDALYDMLDLEKVNRMIEKELIEIAPIAYMRGRTLNDSFIILDEAQNTTSEQMKMFLTRLGYNSKAVITGDVTQIDLPLKKRSGLVEIETVLRGIKEIQFIYFNERDVVRHTLVQKIIKAYERFDIKKRQKSEEKLKSVEKTQEDQSEE